MIKSKVFAFMLLTVPIVAFCACGGEDAENTGAGAGVQSDEGYLSVEPAEGSYPYAATNSVHIGESCTYRVAEFTITLPDSFAVQKREGYSLYASDSKSCEVALTAESFSDIYNAGIDYKITAYEYAMLAIAAKDSVNISEYGSGEEVHFEYVLAVSEVEYRYFVYAYKGSSAFYLLQFNCLKNDADTLREAFDGIAETVVIG